VERLSIQIGGQVHRFDGESQHNRQKKMRSMTGFTQFTLAAAKRRRLPSRGFVFAGELAAKSCVGLVRQAGGS